MSKEFCLGIDLGTTNTVAAVWERDQEAPEVLRINQPLRGYGPGDFRSDEMLPSAVHIFKDRILVGRAVKYMKHLGRDADSAVTSIKRYMGKRWEREIAGKTWRPEEIAACILMAIRNDLRSRYPDPPQQVVITVPASFGTEARRATLKAAYLAGFEKPEPRLLDEPVAALLNQMHRMEGPSHRFGRMHVIDVGGGTLDASMIRLVERDAAIEVDVEGTSRFNEFVAGDDFDLQLVGFLLLRYEDEFSHDALTTSPERSRLFYSELLLRAEEAKIKISNRYWEQSRQRSLSALERGRLFHEFVIEAAPHGKPWVTKLTYADLEVALENPFFPRRREDRRRRDKGCFYGPLHQCLDSASRIAKESIDWDDGVQEVFLTGGASLLPLVHAAVRAITSHRPIQIAEPHLAVAKGAARFAGLLQGGYPGRPLKVIERLYDGLYLQSERGEFKELLPPETIVPTRKEVKHRIFTAAHDRRLELSFFVGRAGEAALPVSNRQGDGSPHAEEGYVEFVPLARRLLETRDPLPPNHPIELGVRVSENREIRLDFRTSYQGSDVRIDRKVSAGIHWEADSVEQLREARRKFPPVNALAT